MVLEYWGFFHYSRTVGSPRATYDFTFTPKRDKGVLTMDDQELNAWMYLDPGHTIRLAPSRGPMCQVFASLCTSNIFLLRGQMEKLLNFLRFAVRRNRTKLQTFPKSCTNCFRRLFELFQLERASTWIFPVKNTFFQLLTPHQCILGSSLKFKSSFNLCYLEQILCFRLYFYTTEDYHYHLFNIKSNISQERKQDWQIIRA